MGKHETKLLNIGFNNGVVSSRIIAIVNPSSSPMKRLREEARERSSSTPPRAERRGPSSSRTAPTSS